VTIPFLPNARAPRRAITPASTALLALAVLAGCAPESPAAQLAPARGNAATAGALPVEWPFQPGSVPATVARGGMATSTDPVASEVGAEILRRGGNAVDAAVAVHFALAVVNPEAGNLGGGGFMVARLADGTEAALDFRETAPAAATRDMFLDARGQPTDGSRVGHRAAGVPGSVAGIWEAHRRFGRLPWDDLVQPAINLAEGIVVHERLAGSLREYATRLGRYPGTAEIFLPGGSPPRVGDRFVQRDLAETLRRIQRDGADGFYRGRTAELIEAEMRAEGGLITREDLARYRAVWRDPIVFDFHGHRVVSMPPPSSGGVTLALILGMLERTDLRTHGWHSARHLHLLAEASRLAYVDRNEYLADPDFADVPLARLLADDYAARRLREIRPDRASPSAQVRPGLGEMPRSPGARAESENTTHYSIVDEEGNAVSVTTTINGLYGSLVTVRGTGVLLNNEMDDFTVKPGAQNMFGLVQGEANVIEPGKRMLSSMTPTIVVRPDGGLVLTGAPGGATIITTVAQVVMNVAVWGMDLPTAASAPRIHHQHLPDVLRFERAGVLPSTVETLRALGHAVEERPGFQGETQSIMRLPDGTLIGVADPRRGGAAVGVRRVFTPIVH
jgi:gamma-glutamyltranspeptidase / glutathione hydrolase